MTELPKTMRAVALDAFGGIDDLEVKTVPVPNVGPEEVLIRVESIGVGVWDPFEISGGFHELGMAEKPAFPYVPGSECAGTVVAAGERATRFAPGDQVYVLTLGNAKGGSYAEHVVVNQDQVAKIPSGIDMRAAGATLVDAITALRGLDDTLALRAGESVMVFGASGGVGHFAVQLAKRMGARVFAVASRQDGVELAMRIGADAVVDGREPGVARAARDFAPEGLDAALVTAGGEAANRALEAVRDGGRIAYPNGVMPVPQPRPGIEIQSFDALPDLHSIEKLNHIITTDSFQVAIGQTFPLEHASDALRAASKHHIGKIVMTPR